MKRNLWVLLAVGVFAVSCKEKSTDVGDDCPLVVATTTMVADLARAVGGDHVRVEGMMGPGVDPHSFVPRLSDSRLLEKADVVLYSGLHLEGKFQVTLEAMAERGGNVLAVTDGIPQAELLAPQEEFEGTKDPHVWGDPRLWAKTVDGVVALLSKVDPAHAAEFQDRGEIHRKELEGLMSWANGRLSGLPEEKRKLVTSHDAFFYFGRAFGFEVRGLQGVSTATEAGIRDRADLVDYLRSQGVKAVFAETSTNEKGIAAVAAEAGVKVSEAPLFSDAIGAVGDVKTVDGESYDVGTVVGMLKHNVNTILKALQ